MNSGQLKEQEEEEGMEMDLEIPDEGEGLELEPEGELDPEGEEGTSVEDFARDVLDAIEKVAGEHGVDMEVEEMPEPEEVEVGEIEPEAEEEGAGLELGGEETGEELALQEVNYIDEGLLMKHVYSRVTKRILHEKKIDDVAETLTNNIGRRLSRRKRR
jgi:hypothetical protein